MKTNAKTKFVSEVDAAKTQITARGPFKVECDNRRRFIRLELSTPMALQTIKDMAGDFHPESDGRVIAQRRYDWVRTVLSSQR